MKNNNNNKYINIHRITTIISHILHIFSSITKQKCIYISLSPIKTLLFLKYILLLSQLLFSLTISHIVTDSVSLLFITLSLFSSFSTFLTNSLIFFFLSSSICLFVLRMLTRANNEDKAISKESEEVYRSMRFSKNTDRDKSIDDSPM